MQKSRTSRGPPRKSSGIEEGQMQGFGRRTAGPCTEKVKEDQTR